MFNRQGVREWLNVEQAADELKERLVRDLESIKEEYWKDIGMAVDFYRRCVAPNMARGQLLGALDFYERDKM